MCIFMIITWFDDDDDDVIESNIDWYVNNSSLNPYQTFFVTPKQKILISL